MSGSGGGLWKRVTVVWVVLVGVGGCFASASCGWWYFCLVIVVAMAGGFCA